MPAGIGRATAKLFASEGCRRVVIADVNANALHEVKAEILGMAPDCQVLKVAFDVKSQTSVQNVVDEAIHAFGRIDYCANVAGIIRFGDTSVLPTSDFDEVYQVNLRGTFLCAKAELGAMLKQEPLRSK